MEAESGIWSEEIEATGVTPATCGRRKEDVEQRLCVQVGGIRRSYEESERQRLERALIRFFCDLRQGFDDGPLFEDAILNFLNVDSARDGAATGHFFGVGVELANIFADDFRAFEFALRGDSWEGNYEPEIRPRNENKSENLYHLDTLDYGRQVEGISPWSAVACVSKS